MIDTDTDPIHYPETGEHLIRPDRDERRSLRFQIEALQTALNLAQAHERELTAQLGKARAVRSALWNRNNELFNTLYHIHEMAEEDLRIGGGDPGTSLFQIEADARAVLNEPENS